jgi:hypothetical protein
MGVAGAMSATQVSAAEAAMGPGAAVQLTRAEKLLSNAAASTPDFLLIPGGYLPGGDDDESRRFFIQNLVRHG